MNNMKKRFENETKIEWKF